MLLLNKTIFYCFPLWILLNTFPSCCREKELGEVKLTAAERALVPYGGFETLTFKSNLGNIITFTGNSKKVHMSKTYESQDMAETSCSDYYMLEEDNTTMNSSILVDGSPKNAYINIRHFYNENDGSIFRDLYISLPDYYNDRNGSTSFSLAINNDKLEISDTSDSYYETLTLNNKTYTKVYKIIGYNWYASYYGGFIHSTILYYNTSKGIISFEMSDSTQYYLQ